MLCQLNYVNKAYRGTDAVYKNAEIPISGEMPKIPAPYLEKRDAANDDTVAIVGVVIIGWPTLLALPLSRDQSAQLAIAHGHYEAVDDAMHLRGCRAGHRKGPGAGSTWLSPRSPVGYSGNTAQWKRHRGDFPPL